MEAQRVVAVVATLSKGYDLEYIWAQVDRGLVKDAAGYYLQASESGGEPPGRWWGPGAKALGLAPGQVVERNAYDLLFGQRKAPDGTRLGRPRGSGRKAADIYARLLAAEPHATAERRRELRVESTRQARQGPLFFDLTISLSKSISIFHASLGENVRLARHAGDVAGEGYWSGLTAEVEAMIWQAVRAGFGYFQREAGYTRTGSHNTRVHGRETGQWHEADLAVAHWLQHTSRDGDMQLHVHSQIAHVAKTRIDGMPDGRLLHLRDTYPVETAWAPPWVGDKLRQVRAAAREARLAGLRACAEAAAAARQRGAHDSSARQQELAASYQALHEAYRQRETVLAATMADRADWYAATRAQRRLAVAADAELRRRHPDRHYSPLRSAEPDPAAGTQRAELTGTPSKPPSEMGKWITDLAVAHRTFADRLADRQSVKIPAEDPTFGDPGQAFPAWPGGGKDAILQPPKPEIRPSPHVLERAADQAADWEAAD